MRRKLGLLGVGILVVLILLGAVSQASGEGLQAGKLPKYETVLEWCPAGYEAGFTLKVFNTLPFSVNKIGLAFNVPVVVRDPVVINGKPVKNKRIEGGKGYWVVLLEGDGISPGGQLWVWVKLEEKLEKTIKCKELVHIIFGFKIVDP